MVDSKNIASCENQSRCYVCASFTYVSNLLIPCVLNIPCTMLKIVGTTTDVGVNYEDKTASVYRMEKYSAPTVQYAVACTGSFRVFHKPSNTAVNYLSYQGDLGGAVVIYSLL